MKKRGEGKAAKRAKDCLTLVNKGSVERAYRLAKKRNISLRFSRKKENGYGFVSELNNGLSLYAKLYR